MKIHVILSVILAVACAGFLALWHGTDAERFLRLQLAVGYGLCVIVFLFGFVILLGIATGEIDISTLLSESGGGASMSRFQLMIFTFVIALSLFFLVANGKAFPPIPAEVLTLLGISATTYGVSKGIQASNPNLQSKGGGGGGGNDGNGGDDADQSTTQPQQPAQAKAQAGGV